METAPITREQSVPGLTSGDPGSVGAGARQATRLTREQSKANTRERLLDAARTVFARGGYHGATVEQVASEAGFS
ncbi:MAG: TetR/AcrR family transcriptional regulator, partial [Solirubrobacteraceae bacterium]